MSLSGSQEREFEALMRAAQDGDAVAYERLLRRLVPALRRVVARRRSFLQAADVEDIVQDILLSLHAVRASWDPSRPFVPWLMAIAANRIADAARRHVRRSTHETGEDATDETFWADETKDVGERLADAQTLAQALGALPAGQRRAIEMLKIRELSLQEAAAASGSSVSALKVAVHRAMATLRRVVKDG
jgi:RNA polymerase sigma-70 factor (ECF subfamily)